MAMNEIAIATTPKSLGARRRARISVLISPRPRSTNLNSTIHSAPRAIFPCTALLKLALHDQSGTGWRLE
ncbi:MAG: hypothetical protein HC793_00460 [Aquincola sp.]|nr:hypothetical protein [Aquincola sp.]